MTWFVGVDVGGTFTDFFAFDYASGRLKTHKRPSTPKNPADAIVDGLRELSALHGISLQEVERLSHGTTVATNDLLQRRGGKVALVTTAGFKDLIEIGRQIRPRMYSLQDDQPAPVVPRHWRFEVAERMLSDGTAKTPLTDEEISGVVRGLRQTGAEACAVCFLFAFLNPKHEQMVAERLRAEFPDVYVSVSSEVQPEFREYERLSTTVLNAYLQPRMDRYLRTLADQVADAMPSAQLGINQSSGGLMSVERARRFPVRTALSGPAAGAMGAIHMASLSGAPDVVTLDMGGTSADVCLIRNYGVGVSFDREVGSFPVRMASIDVNTVGAGGGSIAWFERDGLLKVGPISAGADPGPACYCRGGDKPTVTDANLILGRLSPRGLLGGQMALDPDAARAAYEPIAKRLGFTVEQAAQGVISIVNSNMVRAIRAVSTERGYDPRGLTLMPFGGAGPLHASAVARSLSMRRILVPLLPGILCAQGLIVSDIKEDFVRTVRLKVASSLAALLDELQKLRTAIDNWFRSEAIAPAHRQTVVTLDARYIGQNYELPLRLAGSLETLLASPPTVAAIKTQFFTAHDQQYGFHSEADDVEIVNVRVTAIGSLAKPPAPHTKRRTSGAPQPRERRPVYFDDPRPLEALVYLREELLASDKILGPAIIEQLDTTTVLFPGEVATVDDSLNIVIEVSQ